MYQIIGYSIRKRSLKSAILAARAAGITNYVIVSPTGEKTIVSREPRRSF